jgi:hypothetical protein
VGSAADAAFFELQACTLTTRTLEWPSSSYNPTFGTIECFYFLFLLHTEKHMDHASSFGW